MLRVRSIYLFKKAIRPFVLKTFAFMAVVYGAAQFVFVAKVLENAPAVSHIQDFVAFFTRAFTHTELSVQILILCSAVAATLAFRDIVRMTKMVYEFRWRLA